MKVKLIICIAIVIIFSSISCAQDKNINSNAYNLGKTIGDHNGGCDYVNKKIKNWRDSILKDYDIINNFQLYNEDKDFVDTFIDSYKSGFIKGYNETYAQKQMETINDCYSFLCLKGKEKKATSPDEFLFIDFGESYNKNELYLSIKKRELVIPDKYEKSSMPYKITINNDKAVFENQIILSFDIPYDESIGIYELTSKGWRYLHTNAMNNRIFTNIINKHYVGGTYAVLKDEFFSYPIDINFNWACDEIYIFLKRGYINTYYDNTFKPDEYVTLAYTLNLLSRINKVESMKNIDKLKTKELLTYNFFEKIIKSIPGKENYSWDVIAKNILTKKLKKSSSYEGKENYMTKAEVIYALFLLEAESKI